MTIAVALNDRFKTLNANSLRTKQDFRTRERRAIVDITFTSDETYVVGGVTVDFSTIRNFIEVYAGKVVGQLLIGTGSTNYEFRIESGTSAATTKLSVINLSDGFELTPGTVPNGVVTVEIIGI